MFLLGIERPAESAKKWKGHPTYQILTTWAPLDGAYFIFNENLWSQSVQFRDSEKINHRRVFDAEMIVATSTWGDKL
jgi:hypothetical protein